MSLDDDSEVQPVQGKKVQRLVYEDMTHQEKTLARLNTMRKDGHMCDVTIEIDGHTIPVHGAVLSSLSVYLFELFSSKADSRIKHHFKLDHLDYKSFEVLVNYAYTSKLECDADQVKSVYKTANVLKMHRVADECSLFLANNLTPQNCLGICASINYNDLDLTSRTHAYIQNNLQAVLEQSQEFHRLPAVVVDIVGVEPMDLHNGGEKNLCKLVVDWLEITMEERSLDRLLEDTHILYLSSDNNLRDCLDDVDNTCLNNCDVIKDYKKLVKMKQMLPVKMLKEKNGSRPGRSPTPGNTSLNGHPSTDSLLSLSGLECTLIAACSVGEKSFMCIASLGEKLVSISIKFRSQVTMNTKQSSVQSSSRASSSPSPTDELLSASPLEKQCSLSSLAAMSSARCGLGVAVIRGQLVALGGYDRGECLNTVEAYTFEKNSWLSLKPMLTARGRLSAAQWNDRLYACGGSNGQAELNSVECYDPDTNSWSNVADMHFRRSSAGVAVCAGRLYVVGGWSGVGGRTTCEVYNSDVKQWELIAELNTGRSQAAVCSVNGHMYAVGGCDAWNCTNTIEKYDPVADKWTYQAPMYGARRGAGIAYFKNKLYVVGGSDGQQSLVSVEIYDPATDSWTSGPSLTTPRSNVGVTVVDKRLWALGGFSGKVFLDTIEYLGPDDDSEWCAYLPQTIRRMASSDDLPHSLTNGHTVVGSAIVMNEQSHTCNGVHAHDLTSLCNGSVMNKHLELMNDLQELDELPLDKEKDLSSESEFEMDTTSSFKSVLTGDPMEDHRKFHSQVDPPGNGIDERGMVES